MLRPRRCGKSLALSTIDCYYNVLHSKEQLNKWFSGTKIEELDFPSKALKGKLPVLRMDLSKYDVETNNYTQAFYYRVGKALNRYSNKI